MTIILYHQVFFKAVQSKKASNFLNQNIPLPLSFFWGYMNVIHILWSTGLLKYKGIYTITKTCLDALYSELKYKVNSEMGLGKSTLINRWCCDAT